MGSIVQVELTPLRIIEGYAGNVMHALKITDSCFNGFGEAYISTVKFNHVKGWKKHRDMVLNIVVPVGAIQFVLYDDRKESATYGAIMEIILSLQNYQRLTVPPGVWMAFKGISEGENLLLNVASIPHDPAEAENMDLESSRIPYNGFAV